jgi:phage tail sheath protein FI
MPEYLSPGVYVEEVDAGPKPIEGVSTSITGAVGVTALGPTTGKPVLVTSFAEFVRNFGGYLPDPPSAVYNNWALNAAEGGRWWHFPLAVKGYFDNGGQQLYVKRVFSSQAKASAGSTVQGLVSEIVSDTAAQATIVKLRHVLQVDENLQIHLFRGDTGGEIGGGFGIAAYDNGSGQVTLKAAVPAALVAKRGDFAAIKPVANTTSLNFAANALGAWGDDLSVRVRPIVGNSMTILFDPTIAGNNNPVPMTKVVSTTNVAGPPPRTTVKVEDTTGFADKDHVLINGREFQISNTAAGAPGTFDVPGTWNWGPGTVVKKLRKANTAGATDTFNVRGASSLYDGATVELDSGHLKELFTVKSTAADAVTLSGTPINQYYEGETLRVIEAEVAVEYNPASGNSASEIFSNLRLFDDGSLSYLVNYVNQQSAFVKVTAPGLSANPLADMAKFPTSSNGGWLDLGNGDDRLDGLTVDDFVGVDGGSGARTGIQALEDITDISICVVPGIWSSTVQSALITHCESLRYRFGILDPQDGLSIEKIQEFRAPLDTKYAALYYPWIEVRDPSVSRNVQIAPSAHLAGIYARVDIERGVHKAPANEVLLSINKIAQDVTKREQDVLNPVNINALRFFPGRGNRVWGARVVTSDSSWKYINVRRLFIYVEASIDYGTQWVVFEPNDEPLWARVRQTITNFLTTTWRSGALQ